MAAADNSTDARSARPRDALYDPDPHMHHVHTTRYRLELEMIERDGTLSDQRAAALLRSEFALALNASYLSALSGDDIDVRVTRRSIAQDGVARYAVELELVERTPEMTDEQARVLLRREFQRALNAAHFWRVCLEDLRVTLVARERVRTHATLRAA